MKNKINSWLVLCSSFRPGQGTHQRPFCLALVNWCGWESLCDRRRDYCHHAGTLGAMPSDFATQKGLGSLIFPIQVKKLLQTETKY